MRSLQAAVALAETEGVCACKQEDRQGHKGRSRKSKNMLCLHKRSREEWKLKIGRTGKKQVCEEQSAAHTSGVHHDPVKAPKGGSQGVREGQPQCFHNFLTLTTLLILH